MLGEGVGQVVDEAGGAIVEGDGEGASGEEQSQGWGGVRGGGSGG